MENKGEMEGKQSKEKHYPQLKNEMSFSSLNASSSKRKAQMETALHRHFQSFNGTILYSNFQLYCSCMRRKERTPFFFFLFLNNIYTIGFLIVLVAQLKEQEQQSNIPNWENQE